MLEQLTPISKLFGDRLQIRKFGSIARGQLRTLTNLQNKFHGHFKENFYTRHFRMGRRSFLILRKD